MRKSQTKIHAKKKKTNSNCLRKKKEEKLKVEYGT